MDDIIKVICELWRELLLVDVGPDDDFFESGGHSFLIIEMVARAEELGIDLAPEQVFDYPTPSLLARALQEAP
jgi:acyl carrier protein